MRTARLGYFAGFPECVHAIGINAGGEFTACGMAFDLGETEEPELGRFVDAWRGTVNCEGCAETIEHYRGLRIAPANMRLTDADRDSA